MMKIDILTDHGEQSADGPHHNGHVDAAGGLEHPRRRDKDPAPDDAAHDDGASVQQGHLRLQLQPALARRRLKSHKLSERGGGNKEKGAR